MKFVVPVGIALIYIYFILYTVYYIKYIDILLILISQFYFPVIFLVPKRLFDRKNRVMVSQPIAELC